MGTRKVVSIQEPPQRHFPSWRCRRQTPGRCEKFLLAAFRPRSLLGSSFAHGQSSLWETNPSEPRQPEVTSPSWLVPQQHPSTVRGAESWSPRESPGRRHPPRPPPAACAPDLKAPSTATHPAGRVRHPALGLHTRKPRAEGRRQVQEETPGVLVLSPCSPMGPNPSAAPQTNDTNPTNLQKLSQTSPHAAFSSRIP